MKCKYEGEGRYEGRCMGTKEIDPCPGYDKCSHFKPNFKTNADHIRAMSDEELACELMQWRIETAFRLQGVESNYPYTQKSILEWLKQPKEERE